VPPSSRARENRAAKIFEDFTGHDANVVDIVQSPDYDTYAIIGDVLDIAYRTKRDGKIENYRHEFKKSSRPKLGVSHDGQQIAIIGGRYLFKDSGINDV
jgi:hypothetical protein